MGLSYLGQNFSISCFTDTPTVIFLKVGKIKYFFIFILATLNIIFFVEKSIYFWGSVCVFLRVALLKVIVLPRLLGNYEIFKDLILTAGLLY